MVRVFIVLAALFISGCTDPIEELIPKTSLAGALTVNVDINDIQTGKSVKGGKLVEGVIKAPRNIRNSQIKPTALAVLKTVKKQYPDAEWLYFFMVNDPRMSACSNWVAIAEYKEGEITIKGGLPTDADIKEWNDAIGTPVTNFEDEIIYNDDGTPMLNDLNPVRHPTDEDLQLEHDLCVEYRKIVEEYMAKADALRDQGKRREAERVMDEQFKLTGDEEAMDRLIAKRLGIPYSKIKGHYAVGSYYRMHSGNRL